MLRFLVLVGLFVVNLLASDPKEVVFVKKVVDAFQVGINTADPTSAATSTIKKFFAEIDIAGKVCGRYVLEMRATKSDPEVMAWIEDFSKIYTHHMAVVYTTEENLELFGQYKWVNGQLKEEGTEKWVVVTFKNSNDELRYIQVTLKPNGDSWLVSDIAFGNDINNLINITSADRGAFEAKLSDGEDPLKIFAHNKRERLEKKSTSKKKQRAS